jgi:hypothetical protein
MILHLLRCQGFGGAYYSLILGRLGSTAPSAFATLGLSHEVGGTLFHYNWNKSKYLIECHVEWI